MSTPHLLCLQTGGVQEQFMAASSGQVSKLEPADNFYLTMQTQWRRLWQADTMLCLRNWFIMDLFAKPFFFFYFLTHWNSTSMVLEHPIWIATATERVTAEENLFSWLQMFTLFHNIVYLGLYTTPDLHRIYIPHWFLFPFRYRVVGCCRASWRSVNYRRHFHMLRADAIIKKYMKFVISVLM